MEYDIENVSKLVTIAKPIIDPIISTLIKPKMDQLSVWLKKEAAKNKVEDNFYENKFSDFLGITVDKCSNINMLIFQNQQISINDIYYPLTINSTKENKKFRVDSLDNNMFESYKKILISDWAGMGKSTLSKWICLKAIEQKLALPILIELRNLKDNHGVLDEIFNQINPIAKDFDKDLILKFIELGNFLIIFDGYDEIQIKNQEVIVKDIREFINKAGKNWFLLTSRPEGSLAAFGDFQMFNIESLKNEEPYELIRKYDALCPIKISEALIRDIKEKFDQVRELLGNPFLVSLLYSTYTFNKDIPASKASFYEELYSALFKRHDLSKDGWTRTKKSRLEIQHFRIVLRQLAFDTAILGETNYSEQKLTELIQTAISKCPDIEADSASFFEDLLTTVPLFQRDGLKIKWAHKSIQDFFASEYISYDSKKELFLEKIYTTEVESFNNILEFICELDYKSFRKVIVKKLLEDYIAYVNTSYKTISKSKKFTKDDIQRRKAKTFGIDFIFKNNSSNENGMSDMFDDTLKVHKDLSNRKNKSIIYVMEKQSILVAMTIKSTLIDILAQKGVKFIYDAGKNEGYSHPKIPASKYYRVSENIDDPLNSDENFNDTTSALFYPFRRGKSKEMQFPAINFDEAKIELKNIERDLRQDRELKAFDVFDRKGK